MDRKSDKIWQHTAAALDAAMKDIEQIEGVISIFAQYAEPTAILVVLVDSDKAKARVRELNCRLSHGSGIASVDLHVQQVDPPELELEQEALSSAFSLLWSRN